MGIRYPLPWEADQTPRRVSESPPEPVAVDVPSGLVVVADTSRWDRGLTSRDDTGDDPTPAQHHESRAASIDRAYHIARQGGQPRLAAREIAVQAVDRARRSRGC
jgi:hypothetical protein